MTFTIGCATRPYREWPFDQACEHIAAAGFSDVAVFSDAGITPDTSLCHTRAVRETACSHGLRPSMLIAKADLAMGHEEAAARYKRMVDHAVVLGAKWLLDMGTSNTRHFPSYITTMEKAVPYAASAGVSINLKPHGGLTRTCRDLIRVHKQVGHPAFGVCYDPGNIIYYTNGAARPEECAADVAPYVTTAIIKDCVVLDGRPDVLVTPGQGLVDWECVLSGLCSGGFGGPFYLECVGGKMLSEINRNVRQAREYIERILANLGTTGTEAAAPSRDGPRTTA
jgi:sugar phosphate isomerase/epimerase